MVVIVVLMTLTSARVFCALRPQCRGIVIAEQGP